MAMSIFYKKRIFLRFLDFQQRKEIRFNQQTQILININEGFISLKLKPHFIFMTGVIVSDISRKVGPEVLYNFLFQERRNYFSNSGRICFWLIFFVGIYFHTKKIRQ